MRYQPSLQTQRLRLRPFVADDAETVSQLAGTAEVANAIISIPHPYSITAAKTWIAGLPHLYRTGQAVHFALSLLDSKQLIGAFCLRNIHVRHASAELEFWIGAAWQRQGYATEAMQAVLTFGFEELDLHRIAAFHITGHQPSAAFLAKQGFSHEGVLRDAVRKNGRFQDVSLAAILAAT